MNTEFLWPLLRQVLALSMRMVVFDANTRQISADFAVLNESLSS